MTHARAGLCQFLTKLLMNCGPLPTVELVAAAQDEFGPGVVGSQDVYAALNRLVSRGELVQLKSNVESWWHWVEKTPAPQVVRELLDTWYRFISEEEAHRVLYEEYGIDKWGMTGAMLEQIAEDRARVAAAKKPTPSAPASSSSARGVATSSPQPPAARSTAGSSPSKR